MPGYSSPIVKAPSCAAPIFGASFEKVARWAFFALLAYTCVRSVLGAAAKLFWYDELCTFAVASQVTLRDLWGALRRAADSHPPPYYLVERVTTTLTANYEIGYRIPGIIAFLCALWFSFVFVGRRIGSGGALVCSAVLLLTVYYDHYPMEARPYSIVVSLIALAIVCYQRAPAGGWMALMALSFVLAESFHYYAVYSIVPFAVAESVWFFKTKELRIRVWLACASGIVPILAFWPFLRIIKQYYGSHFWAPLSLYDTAKAYSYVFLTPQASQAAFSVYAAANKFHFLRLSPRAVNILFTAILLAVVVAGANLLTRKGARARLARDPDLHEHVLALAFFTLPFVGFIAAKLTHGGFTPRYVLAMILGVPLAIKFLLTRLKRGWAIALSAVLVLLVVLSETAFWSSDRGRPDRMMAPIVAVENLVDSAHRPDLPVLVSDGLEYLPLAHYASREWAHRVVAVVDEKEAVKYTGADSIDKELVILKDYMPINVREYPEFAAQYRTFLLLADAHETGNWWVTRFAREGQAMSVVAKSHVGAIYLVTLNAPESE